MKRISLILGIAAFVAAAAPLSAQEGGKYGRNDSRIHDRNGDGRIDLVKVDGQNLVVVFNKGDGTFGPANISAGGRLLWAMRKGFPRWSMPYLVFGITLIGLKYI